MVYDDDQESSFYPIQNSDRPLPSIPPPIPAKREAIIQIVEARPAWSDLPRHVYDVIRTSRHDITLDEVRVVLADLQVQRHRER